MRKSRLEWAVQERLMEHFVSGSTDRTAAALVPAQECRADKTSLQRIRPLIYSR